MPRLLYNTKPHQPRYIEDVEIDFQSHKDYRASYYARKLINIVRYPPHAQSYTLSESTLQSHAELSKEEKKRICYALNYEKLSSECCKHLAHNSNFPSSSSVQALASQQNRLKSLLEDTNQPKPSTNSPYCSAETEIKGESEESCEQTVLYAGRLDISDENEKLKANLQGMRCRVLELENVCKKMQNQMAKMLKSKLSGQSNARSLPMICS